MSYCILQGEETVYKKTLINRDGEIDSDFKAFNHMNQNRILHQGNQLLQIFIPAEIAQRTMYQSAQFGHPYLYDIDNYEKTSIITFINDLRAGKIDFKKYLVPTLRIILNSIYFANPKSGIKMYRYSTASEHEIKKSEQERNERFKNLIF